MTRKEFLCKHTNFKISERWFPWGPRILIQVHDTTSEPHTLVFEHFI